MKKTLEELEKELKDFKEDHFGQGWTIKMNLEEEIERLKIKKSVAKLNPNKTENNV